MIGVEQCYPIINVFVSFFKDENSLLRYVNDTNRSIYAFELLPPPAASDLKNNKSEENSQLQVKLKDWKSAFECGGLVLLIQKPHIRPRSEPVQFKVSAFQIVPICTYFFPVQMISKFHTFFHCPLTIKMLWTDPNGIPSMLATSWIVILVFLMTTALSWSTFLCVLLVHVHLECAAFSTVVTPLLSWENHTENCVIPIIWSPASTISMLKFQYHFSPV